MSLWLETDGSEYRKPLEFNELGLNFDQQKSRSLGGLCIRWLLKVLTRRQSI